MECRHYKNDSKQVAGYWFEYSGSVEKEGDYICSYCMENILTHLIKIKGGDERWIRMRKNVLCFLC